MKRKYKCLKHIEDAQPHITKIANLNNTVIIFHLLE